MHMFRGRPAVTLTGVILLTLVSWTTCSFAQAPGKAEYQTTRIEGSWQGTLKIKGIELRVVFNVSRNPDSTFTATLDSPDQGARDIPVDEVTFDGRRLLIDMKSIAGSFDGKFKEDGSGIEGEWSQGGMSLPLVLERLAERPEVRRPQEPKKPYPYNEEEVSYSNEKSGNTLAGTLTFPKGDGPFPAVILITGSGQQDRDESVFGHKPFLVLADYLTRLGIAVLRVDDRGVGKSTGDVAGATSETFATDVLAGVKYLKSRKEINARKIGLAGHSEGGLIAPMVAVQSKDVAFIVLMAGPAMTGEQILYRQAALIARANGADEKSIDENRVLQEKLFAVLKHEKNDSTAARNLREIMTAALKTMSDDERKSFGHSEAAVESEIRQLTSPWFRQFIAYNPVPTLKKVKCPVLAIDGEKDLQVPCKENLAAIDKALKAGGNKDYTVKELDGLNHLFQTANTGALFEYGKIEETMSPVALKTIADWILEHCGKVSGVIPGTRD